MNLRREKGATLGLVAVLVLSLALIGSCFFFLARILGGDKQSINATDAGALTAARSMLAVGLPNTSVAPEFQGLGIDVHTGRPDPNNGRMNLFAYNRAAGAACLIAMNALEDGNPVGVVNANSVVTSLRVFGDALNGALLASGHLGSQTAQDFQRVATENNVNMLGSRTSTNLSNDLQFTSVTTGTGGAGGKSNVYFNSAVFTADPFLANAALNAQDLNGPIRSVALPDPNGLSYQLPPLYQIGQPLLRAYQPITFDPRIAPIFLAAVNPVSKPHLIDNARFNQGAPRFGSAPVNSVQGQTLTRETYKTNNLLNAVACAVVGAIYNEYPIILNHGYVRIHNGPDARVANPALAGIYGTVNGQDNIFNRELWIGSGGGIFLTNNGVFFTQFAPRALAETNAYINYNTHGGGSDPDPRGRDPKRDPAVGLEFSASVRWELRDEYAQNPYRFDPFWPPNNHGSAIPSLRKGPNHNQAATYADLLNINHRTGFPCLSNMYGQPNIPLHCLTSLPTWQGNYGSVNGGGSPLPPNIQVTNFEAFKGKVETEWVRATQSGNFSDFSFHTTGAEFGNPSGSKTYARVNPPGYANPSNTPTIAFGNVASPGALLIQLAQNGGSCANVDDPAQWNNPGTMLGKLLQRCREIVPSTDYLAVRNLLFTPSERAGATGHNIDLDAEQYIYSADGITLTLGTSPPYFLRGLPEYTNPGITRPDGNFLPNCRNVDFTGGIGNHFDAAINAGAAGSQNGHGDIGLHNQPWESFTGEVRTHDYATWQSSSGKDNLLGELSFYNSVNANAEFSSPN